MGNRLGLLIYHLHRAWRNALGALYYGLSTEIKGLRAGLQGIDVRRPLNSKQVAALVARRIQKRILCK